MVRRRTLLGVIVGMALLGSAAPQAFGDSLTVYRLEPLDGWVELPPVNPYAAALREAPLQGWSTAGAVSWPVRATARFEPDIEKAELSVDFVPVSGDIRPSDARLFIAPLGRRLEWRVVITVRNPNEVVMRDVKVRDEFGQAFRATLAGQPRGNAAIEGDHPRGRLPLHPTFIWDVGDLGAGEAARAEVTVVTGHDGSGNRQFSREGVYSIDTGARLTYVVAGKPLIRNAAPASVIARRNAGALRGDGVPFDVVPDPIAGGRNATDTPVVPAGQIAGGALRAGTAIVVRDSESGGAPSGVGSRDIGREHPRFTVTVAGRTPNISEDAGRFVVPTGEYAEWELSVKITCQEWVLTGWEMTLDLGPELMAEEIPGSRDIEAFPDPGAGPAPVITRDPLTGRVEVVWNWSGVGVFGASGGFKLRVCTAAPTGYDAPGEFVFCDNMALSYSSLFGSGQLALNPPLTVEAEGQYADVSLDATRLDWRVRKAGTYAALAAEMSVAGSGNLLVQFDGFGDLERLDGGASTIATWYGLGNDLAAVESAGWIEAGDLNLDSNSWGPVALSPTTPTTIRMWSRISVGEEDVSCEYENVGVITFVVSNN